jgi:hypothetical protein
MHLIEPQLVHKAVHPNKQRKKQNIRPLHADVEVADPCGRQRPSIPEPHHCLLRRGRLPRRRPVSGAGRNRWPGRWPPNNAVPLLPGEAWLLVALEGRRPSAARVNAAGATSPEWRWPQRTAMRAPTAGSFDDAHARRRTSPPRRHASWAAASLSSTSIGRRRSILCGCGGSAAWANGSEVGERRGRQAGAGEDGGGRGQRDAGDLGFGDGSRSEGWIQERISERGMCSGRVLGLVSCVLGCSLQTKTHKSSFAA